MTLVHSDASRLLPPPEPPQSAPVPARVERPSAPIELTSPARQNARLVLLMIVAVCLGLLLEATFISGLQHRAAQTRLFASMRKALALGTAPTGQLDHDGHLLSLGTPVALLDVPSIRIHEVVGEGTVSSVLADGPGHTRTSPLPGQAGTSVILGRRSAFGGPFKRLRSLKVGAVIDVATAQGRSQYRVIGVRHQGDPLPPALADGRGRLVLVTADGSPLRPSGVVYVDADLVTDVYPSAPRGRAILADNERPLGTDGSTSWALVLWLQGLILCALGAVWSWHRWGHRQTVIVFAPAILLAAIGATAGFLQLLPNIT